MPAGDNLDEQVSARVPPGTWKRLDRLAAAMAKDPARSRQGRWGRSRVLREVIGAGLDAIEAELAGASGAKARMKS